MRDTVIDAALAAVLKSNAPGLYQAIAALVDAGESRTRIVAAIRRSSGGRGLTHNVALSTVDYLLACKRQKEGA